LEGYFIHNWRVCFIEINVRSLRKPLCNQSRFVSYHLIIFIPFLNEYLFESNRKDSRTCKCHVNEHLSFLKRVKLNFDCFFSFVPVRAPFALCHGLRIWIRKECFSNDGWEPWVDNCSIMIIYFSGTSIVDENLLYPCWCLMIPQYEIIKIFWHASILVSNMHAWVLDCRISTRCLSTTGWVTFTVFWRCLCLIFFWR
jgi:hypothetical protein